MTKNCKCRNGCTERAFAKHGQSNSDESQNPALVPFCFYKIGQLPKCKRDKSLHWRVGVNIHRVERINKRKRHQKKRDKTNSFIVKRLSQPERWKKSEKNNQQHRQFKPEIGYVADGKSQRSQPKKQRRFLVVCIAVHGKIDVVAILENFFGYRGIFACVAGYIDGKSRKVSPKQQAGGNVKKDAYCFVFEHVSKS